MQEKIVKKILIIEDEKELAFGLATLLKSQGYLVIIANDSLFGISSAYKEKLDLIILDLGLPAGGGFYVLENLKKSIKTSNIPVLILTAQQGVDLEERARRMGAVAYFHKPFDPELLSNQINNILNNSN
jgi:DNA-binding response OmpR family regulator